MLAFLKNLTVVAFLTLAATASAYSAPKTVLVVGDSLSAEYGLQRGRGWVALLAQRLAREKSDATVGPNISLTHFTISSGCSYFSIAIISD